MDPWNCLTAHPIKYEYLPLSPAPRWLSPVLEFMLFGLGHFMEVKETDSLSQA